MRYRFVGLLLTLTVVVSVAACGSSSKSKTTSTAAPTATTSTSASTATTSTAAAGPTAAACAQATKDLQPLQAAAAANNSSQIVAQAGQSAPKLTALQSRPGISPQLHAALGELTGALEAFAHGARGQATATQLSNAGKALIAACG